MCTEESDPKVNWYSNILAAISLRFCLLSQTILHKNVGKLFFLFFLLSLLLFSGTTFCFLCRASCRLPDSSPDSASVVFQSHSENKLFCFQISFIDCFLHTNYNKYLSILDWKNSVYTTVALHAMFERHNGKYGPFDFCVLARNWFAPIKWVL
jgi:hypothetical protein